MQFMIFLLILIPFAGFAYSLFLAPQAEEQIATVAFSAVLIQLGLSLVFFLLWLFNLTTAADVNRALVILQDQHDKFAVNFIYDKGSAVFLSVGGILTAMIVLYSRAYLHREEHYKRFYNTILLFYTGYVITILSGNLETWFIGWEFLGVSSFLLISFYKDRYLPVKNAFKVFIIYRLADIGIILAIWAFHSLLKSNSNFLLLSNASFIQHNLQNNYVVMLFISLMLVLSAAAKSAQLPFSAWLPRAMEGPTSSSAIFYGSLSVHIGVFLLYRTYGFWQHLLLMKFLIGGLGLATTIIASGIARAQSSIKSQIAYSSIAQIGLMFGEISLGFTNLVLLHFAGNAFFRTYQLLVSPSIVSHAIRELSYSQTRCFHSFEDLLPRKIKYSLYILYLKEGNLDTLLYAFLWLPLKTLGNKLHIIRLPYQIGLFILSLGCGVYLLNNSILNLHTTLNEYMAVLFAIFGVMALLKAFTFRRSASGAWLLVIMNHCYLVLALSCKERFYVNELIIYLSGVLIAGVCGYVCLYKLAKAEGSIQLDRFYGYASYHPRLEIIFFLSCLGMMGFPISPTFIGEDLLFAHLGHDQFVLAFLVSLSFILAGIAIMRIYARLFMGQDIKTTPKFAARYY